MHNVTNGDRTPNPLWGPWAILLAALSLSIGWGIRGNYGHEIGAMFPGALAAIAVCLLSNREDWRERLPYFACFGALGWAFGGSISYMQVVAYTQSGHAPSQFYGYWGLFLIGFLWASLGGAATALPALLDRKSLCEMFRPLSLLLTLWVLLYFVETPLSRMIQIQFGGGININSVAHRHESVLYWFDSDWISVFVVLTGILVFDLVDRRFRDSLWLPLFAAVGAGLGYFVEWGIVRAGWSDAIHDLLVRSEGGGSTVDNSRFVTNWPELFFKGSDYIGLGVGLALGIGLYFFFFGKFRRGSSLFLHMALGWFAGFLLFPVLLDVRMTPPRGDNWAGIVGVVAGVLIYAVRHKWWPMVVATLVAGTIGGLGLTGIACLETLLESFGSPNLAPNVADAWTRWQTEPVPSWKFPPDFVANVQPGAAWQFWQKANWHSFLEQSYGFVNGIGVIAALALLVRRTGPLNNEVKRQYWTEIVAVTLALPLVLYANMIRNVSDWTKVTPPNTVGAIPKVMRVPLVDFPLSAWTWFNILFGVAALAFIMLLSIHSRRRLALLDQSRLGRGQLFFLVLLWAFVIGNFGRAIPGFEERRLLTEGVITLNAVFATILVLLVPKAVTDEPQAADRRFGRMAATSLLVTVICAACIPPLETLCVRAVYGDAPGRRAGANGPEMRFGPRATWKHRPLLKGSEHI